MEGSKAMFGTRNFELGTKLWFLLLVIFAVLGLSLTSRVQAQSASDIVYVESISWNSDGTRLAVGYDTPLVEVYNADTFELVSSFEIGEATAQLAWSPTAPNILAVVGAWVYTLQYGTLQVFDLQTQLSILSVANEQFIGLNTPMWSPQGDRIAAIVEEQVPGARYSVRTWSLETGQEEVAFYDAHSITAATWSPVDDRIVVSTAASFTPIRLVMHQIGQDQPLFEIADAHEGTISDIAWSPDARSIVTASFAGNFDGLIRIWDTQSGELVRVSEDSDYWAVSASWSPDGAYIAVTNRASVDILDPLSGSRVETYATNLDVQQSVAYSPFGGRLAFGGVLRADSPVIDVPGTAIADGAVWIVVPLPSLERLEAVETLCAAAASDATVFDTLATDDLLDYINQVEALADDGQIAPGCAADLIAVAQAILAGE
jgi:WD40 repeat protein